MDPETDVASPPDYSDDEEPPMDEKEVGKEDNITGDGGVLKKILKAGHGTYPEPGSEVTVHYVGKLQDGTVFDSSRDRGEPFKFNLGKGEVIQGWDRAVAKMRRAETSLLTIEPQYGYGDQPQGKIPPNSTLQFEVELISAIGEKDISKDFSSSLLLKQVKEAEATSWENPSFEAVVTFTAKCLSGNAKSYDNVTVKLGYGQIAEKGLRRALRRMCKGEEAVITAKAGTVYNDGPNDQVWEVKLSTFEKAVASWSLDGPQQLQKAHQLKDQGNEYYKEKNYKQAGKFYKHAAEFLTSEHKLDAAQKVELKKLKSIISSNHAAVAIHFKNWTKAKDLATTAVTSDALNFKALLRRGKALNELDQWEDARRDLNQAIFLATDKDDKATIAEAKSELAKIAAKDRAKFQQEQKVFKGLFEKLRPLEEEEEKAREAQRAAWAEQERLEREAREKEAAAKAPSEEAPAADTTMADAAPADAEKSS